MNSLYFIQIEYTKCCFCFLEITHNSFTKKKRKNILIYLISCVRNVSDWIDIPMKALMCTCTQVHVLHIFL